MFWTKVKWKGMSGKIQPSAEGAASDRFATTWAEISVGCEACYGQGLAHVAWAREKQSWWPSGKTDDPAKGLVVRFDERSEVAWTWTQSRETRA
jgi:hypothetical protein